MSLRTVPTHNLPGRDTHRETLGIAETSEVASPSPNYIYYRIYHEDGAIPLKTPVTPGDAFLGRIKARSVPPPRNAEDVKCSIAKVENIKDSTSNRLFLTPYSESPMGDAEKITILNGTYPGSTPQEPLALVAKMSEESERSILESEGRGGVASAEPDTIMPRCVYYLLYADGYEMPSKVAIDPEEPCLGRIRAESIAPPHSPASIKRHISRVERNPELAHANLFADSLCDTPLEEGHISLLRADGPGLSPNEPMAIVQVKKRPASLPVASIPDGKYFIKNRIEDIYWWAMTDYTKFFNCKKEFVENLVFMQWDITHDTNGNISIISTANPSSWVGFDITGFTARVPWRLIPADGKFYYLTTDLNRVSHHPRVLAAQLISSSSYASGLMATLKEGDQSQMWEFIRI